MKLKFALVALVALAAASGPAGAEGFGWGSGLGDLNVPHSQNLRWGAGLKDAAVPAPIPVPAPVPVQEGFTYYFRADFGYGTPASDPKYSENGFLFGTGPDPFTATGGPFTFGQTPFFGPLSRKTDDVLTGTVGIGAYITQRLRGDITIDFRNSTGFDVSADYVYASTTPGSTIFGTQRESFKVRTSVVMVNGYVDILPRGIFTPYVGAGIGFAYHDIQRSRFNQEIESDNVCIPPACNSQTFVNTSKDHNLALAAALMAGISFAFDHRWVLDVNYRALYLDGGELELTSAGQTSMATIGSHWEHQVRAGVRFNIW